MSSHKWHTSSRRFQNTPKPSWNCLNRIARDLSPDALYVGSQEMNESSLRWGRSPVSFAGFRHNVEAMRSCSGISQHRRVQRTYRLRFEKRYIPSPSIWMRTATAASTITTFAPVACGANVDNVFWGAPDAMHRLIQTWYSNVDKYSKHPSTAHNPERSICLASRDANVTMSSHLCRGQRISSSVQSCT